MKTSQLLLSFFIIFIFMTSCTVDTDFDGAAETSALVTVEKSQRKFLPKFPRPSKNTLIVLFKDEVSENLKEDLRARYKVQRSRRCDCSNNSLETWTFAPGVDIEGRKGDIAQEGGVEGVDFLFNYTHEYTLQIAANTSAAHTATQLQAAVYPYPVETTIAILDTGIDLSVFKKREPFLYNNSANPISCDAQKKEISGWDFVNQDPDPFDDHGHGSAITHTIQSQLRKAGFDSYTLLPVKIFDDQGKGSTFNILCGYMYAASKPEVRVMNMSFGWYGARSTILERLIHRNTDILHVASAGNSHANTDKTPHYPSNIQEKHVISVGACEQVEGGTFVKTPYSNYGILSVDFLAQDGFSFVDYKGNPYVLKGTSYAAALVSAKAALQSNYPKDEIQTLLYQQATPNSTLLPVGFTDVVIESYLPVLGH